MGEVFLFFFKRIGKFSKKCFFKRVARLVVVKRGFTCSAITELLKQGGFFFGAVSFI